MNLLRRLAFFAVLPVSLFVVMGASAQITPGTVFNDTDGHAIEAHGGGMIKVGETYYWIGENKSQNSAAFYANSCYSSKDLEHWKFIGNPLKVQASGDLGPNRIVERPKILFNKATGLYVMYMHVDSSDYKEAKVGVAVSKTVCGAYEYKGSFQPLCFQSRDLGLYQDGNGLGYLLTEDRVNGLRIERLTKDYLGVESSVAVLPDMEAPAVVKVGPLYYMFSSYLSGWKANDNQYATATSLSGPWSAMKPFALVGSLTYGSQTAYVLPVQGSQATTYIYMGDIWNPKDFPHSAYVWLPLKINANGVTMDWVSKWTLNAGTGRWVAGTRCVLSSLS